MDVATQILRQGWLAGKPLLVGQIVSSLMNDFLMPPMGLVHTS